MSILTHTPNTESEPQPESIRHNPTYEGAILTGGHTHCGSAFQDNPDKNTLTDYNYPQWFWDKSVTDEERSRWMTQERCRRQAKRQFNHEAMKITEEELSQLTRQKRKIKAGTAAVNVEKYR